MNPIIEEIEVAFVSIGFCSATPERRQAIAKELAEEGFTELHLESLMARCVRGKNPGALCQKILSEDWKAELAVQVQKRQADHANSFGEKLKASLDAELEQRAKWNGRTAPEQIIEDRQSKVWELITRVHLKPAEAAERMHCSVDQILADLTERGSRFGRTLQQVLETSDPEMVARNIERIKRATASKRRADEAKAAREIEPLKLLDQAEPKPAPSHVPGPQLPFTTAEIEAAAERSREFRERHLAMTDRAWAERFGLTLQIIDPDLHRRMVSGPEPEVWIRQRVCAPIENLFRDARAELRRRTSTEGHDRPGRRR